MKLKSYTVASPRPGRALRYNGVRNGIPQWSTIGNLNAPAAHRFHSYEDALNALTAYADQGGRIQTPSTVYIEVTGTGTPVNL